MQAGGGGAQGGQEQGVQHGGGPRPPRRAQDRPPPPAPTRPVRTAAAWCLVLLLGVSLGHVSQTDRPRPHQRQPTGTPRRRRRRRRSTASRRRTTRAAPGSRCVGPSVRPADRLADCRYTYAHILTTATIPPCSHSRRRGRRRGTWSTCATCPRSACTATRATPRACRPSSSSPSTDTSSSGTARHVRAFGRSGLMRGCLPCLDGSVTPIPTHHHRTTTYSASLDGKCKIWDVYNERQVKRTYSGHSAAIRCVNFNEDGTRYAFY